MDQELGVLKIVVKSLRYCSLPLKFDFDIMYGVLKCSVTSIFFLLFFLFIFIIFI